MKKRRLDQATLDSHPYLSLKKVQALILCGHVLVNQIKISNLGFQVSGKDVIHLNYREKKYVSRSGHKLDEALQHTQLCVKNKICLDIGISTGGFSDCLLAHGAGHVFGVDVGYGITDYTLRKNPKLTLIERCNARTLTPESFSKYIRRPSLNKLVPQLYLVVMDVSFISILKILPAIYAIVPQNTRYLLLIKPQFEGLPSQLAPGGIVKDESNRLAIIETVRHQLQESSFSILDSFDSKTKGTKGNQEHFIYLSR